MLASTLPRAALALTVLSGASFANEGLRHLSIVRQGDDSAGVLEANEYFGAAVATGDFNADGYEDLATGSPGDGALSDDGGVVISYGSEFGLTHVDALWIGPIAAGIDEGDNAEFGFSLAAGDFDGDGADDLVVGAPGKSIGGQPQAGAIYLFYGAKDVGLVSAANTSFNQLACNDSPKANERFGHSLAAGSLGPDDGFCDLAIGSIGEKAGKGAVSWMRGASPLGLKPNSGDTWDASELPVVPGGSEKLGWSLAIGELAGTPGVGHGDLAVGEPFWDLGGLPDVGRVIVLNGNATGVSSAAVDEYIPLDFGLIDIPGELFGWALAAGDYYGHADGRDDLAASALGGNFGTGAVGVSQNGGAGIGGAFAALLQSAAGEVPEAGDAFGYSLAAGDFDDDGVCDLAAGSPFETLEGVAGGISSGLAQLFLGSPAGLIGAETWREDALFDDPNNGAIMGHALVFGHFDDSGRANLAVGTPGKASAAGQVYIIAPWRQVLPMPSRSSIAVDCNDNIVFSQKPFEERYIASTTKIMTVLLACEAIDLPANDPLHVDADYEYVVPQWLADVFSPGSGCSQLVFVGGEKMELIDLMRVCIAISGNDAAHAIAQVLTGEPATQWDGNEETSKAFVDRMNARAAQLGMEDTLFTNPSGVDDGDPYSTAYDMWLLSRAAMRNSRFRQLVGTTTWNIVRHFPFGDLPTVVAYGWLQTLQGELATATGLKPGGTPLAARTGCFGGRGDAFPWGEALAGSFYTENTEPYFTPGADLLRLALEDCGGDPYIPTPYPDPNPPRDPGVWDVPGIDVEPGSAHAVSVRLEEEVFENVELNLSLAWGGVLGKVTVAFVVARDSSVVLEPGETATFGMESFDAHEGLRIVNQSKTDALTLEVLGYENQVLMLMPGQAFDFPPSNTGCSLCPPLKLSNIGATAGQVGVAELGYVHSVQLGGLQPTKFATTLFSEDDAWLTRIDAQVRGVEGSGTVRSFAYLDQSGFNPSACEPDWTLYGQGWPGLLGEPFIGYDAPPKMGDTIHLQLGNSSGANTVGLLGIGVEPAALPTEFGGIWNVNHLALLTLGIPKTGLSIPWPVEVDPQSCGLKLFTQLVEFDPAASKLLSFSRGLEATIGE